MRRFYCFEQAGYSSGEMEAKADFTLLCSSSIKVNIIFAFIFVTSKFFSTFSQVHNEEKACLSILTFTIDCTKKYSLFDRIYVSKQACV